MANLNKDQLQREMEIKKIIIQTIMRRTNLRLISVIKISMIIQIKIMLMDQIKLKVMGNQTNKKVHSMKD